MRRQVEFYTLLFSLYFHKRDRVFQRAFNEATLSFARGGDTTERESESTFLRSCQETKKEGRRRREGKGEWVGECEV